MLQEAYNQLAVKREQSAPNTSMTEKGAERPEERNKIETAISLRYYMRNGSPTGAHLLSFSRNALKAMAEEFEEIHTRSHDHLLGFDTFLDRLRRKGRVRLSTVAREPIAYQRKHPLQKRK